MTRAADRPTPASPGDHRVTPVVRSVATASPEHRATQSDVKEAARALFPRLSARPQLLGVFDNPHVQHRHFAMPLEWYLTPRSWPEKNAVYTREALRLSERAARTALDHADVRARDVDAIVVVSTTGISTPSFGAHLIPRLGINAHATRLPVWGLGCAGGAAGLARAADLVRAGHQNVLLVAVELCSLTLVHADESSSNFIGTSLFADGAAAVLLSPEGTGAGPRVIGHHSTLIPDSHDVMGWDVTQDGLQVRFSRNIPTLVRALLPANFKQAVNRVGWDPVSVQHHVPHPGGDKVISAYEDTLGLKPGALHHARGVLRDHGNMSSPTVLYVLERTLLDHPAGRAVLTAMGPGFSIEHVLLEF